MADQRIQCSEEMVGAGHPTKQDTLNRLMLVEHENDGTHKSGNIHGFEPTDSPEFVTVKLSGLSDGVIPYNVDAATGLADGPSKTDVDDAVTKKHAAVTIDGTSPLSLSGQAISIKNDAAAAITEIDTGVLANSDTVIPTSKAVLTAMAAAATHPQGTDTTLGTMTADIDMGTHQVTALDAPAALGEAIRQTAKITEAALESAVDLKHAAVTIDGTSPLSLSGQAISLKNDAAAAITEVDTGALANSDTVVPTSKAVKTYADTKIAKATNVTAITDTGIADGEIAVFNLSNKDIRTSNVLISTDDTLAGNADTNVPTEQAVKTYVDAVSSSLTASLPVFTDANSKLITKSLLAAVQTLRAQPAGVMSLADSATLAIDWNSGATYYIFLEGTGRTVTFANPIHGQVYRIVIQQDANGSRTITTWPTIRWAGGSPPTLSVNPYSFDIVTLLYIGSYLGDCSFAFA